MQKLRMSNEHLIYAGRESRFFGDNKNNVVLISSREMD